MVAEHADPADDPDLQHLLDLIDLLPSPGDREFWTRVDGKGYHAASPDHHVDYVVRKIYSHLAALHRTPTPRSAIPGLAQYLLMFFGEDCPPLWALLDSRLPAISLPRGTLGRRWAKDLSDTAWRLYVRYSADGSWREKWADDPVHGRDNAE